MTFLEAITSATKFGTEACGIEDKVGTLAKNKIAGFIVVKKDPVANIDVLLEKDNIKFVIKSGNLVTEN